jgi:transmembrane 9 superfamily protein 2/4
LKFIAADIPLLVQAPSTMRSALLLLVLLVVAAHAYVLPGTRPQEYNRGDRIELKVGQLDSVRTQVPFEYYQLPFCKPEVIEQSAENLGEVMSGDVIQNSIYEVYAAFYFDFRSFCQSHFAFFFSVQVNTKVVESCKILCKRDYTAAELAVFADKIDDDYRVHWMLDNLPAATKYYVEIVDTANPSASPVYQPRYEKGFSLGFVGSEKIPRTTPGLLPFHSFLLCFICQLF